LKKSKKMNRKIWIGIISVAILLLVVLIWQLNRHYQEQFLEKIQIEIKNPADKLNFDESDILQMLLQQHGNLLTRKIKEVNTIIIYDSLQKNPWFKNIQIYLQNNILHIELTVRNPIARLFPLHQESYFLDDEGYELPHPQKPIHHVIPISGKYIPPYVPASKFTLLDSISYDSLQKVSILSKIYTLAYKIEADSLLKEIISQIHVQSSNNFEIITFLSDHIYILGDLDDIELKLLNLKNFLMYGYPKIDASLYETFNFQYINQVVGTKKIEKHE